MSLSERDIARIAAAVVELLEDRRMADGIGQLVDVAELARRLGVSKSFVYHHAAELGGQRLGNGQKPRLRFSLETAISAYKDMETPISVPEAPRPRVKRPKTSSAPLLPIKGTAA